MDQLLRYAVSLIFLASLNACKRGQAPTSSDVQSAERFEDIGETSAEWNSDGTLASIKTRLNSATNYKLGKQESTCRTWPTTRVSEAINRLPTALIAEWTGENLESVRQSLSSVPNAYLDAISALHAKNGFKISPGEASFSGGTTIFAQNEATRILIEPSAKAIQTLLLRQIGAALYPLFESGSIAKGGASFSSDLALAAERSSTNRHLNPNIQTLFPAPGTEADPKRIAERKTIYVRAFWAEAFNSRYCGEASDKLLAEQFSETRAVLLKHAEPALWEGQGTGANPQTVDPDTAKRGYEAIPIGTLRNR